LNPLLALAKNAKGLRACAALNFLIVGHSGGMVGLCCGSDQIQTKWHD